MIFASGQSNFVLGLLALSLFFPPLTLVAVVPFVVAVAVVVELVHPWRTQRTSPLRFPFHPSLRRLWVQSRSLRSFSRPATLGSSWLYTTLAVVVAPPRSRAGQCTDLRRLICLVRRGPSPSSESSPIRCTQRSINTRSNGRPVALSAVSVFNMYVQRAFLSDR